MYRRLKETPVSDQIYQTLKINLQTYNRILKCSIRKAKKDYYHSRFVKCKNDIKKTWTCIKDVLNSSQDKNFPNHFLVDNIPCSNNNTIANKFNQFFVNIGPSLANEIHPPINMTYQCYLNDTILPVFVFQNVTEEYVSKLIDQMKSKTSRGVDDLSNKLLKDIKDEIVPPLTVMINHCLNSGIFPDKLKVAKVMPVYKKCEKYLFNNYRPISILPSVSKVFERVMHNQLYSYLTNNHLLYENQYGFRDKHSTELAALDLVDRLICAMDSKNVPLSIFLDLSKAFDTLDHSILLHKLNYYGVHGNSLNLFRSYLSQRKQFVEYNNCRSDCLSITTGVPQGSILGPLLFIIYLNDIANVCDKFIKPVIYADDTALCATLKTTNNSCPQFISSLNE